MIITLCESTLLLVVVLETHETVAVSDKRECFQSHGAIQVNIFNNISFPKDRCEVMNEAVTFDDLINS